MATYRYKARDKAGVATLATLEADSRDAVARQLRNQGLQIITLEEAQGAALDLDRMLQRVRRAPRPLEVVLFTRQLALMVRSGLPLIDGIEGIAEQSFSPVFKETLARIGGDLRGGKSFSEALTAHPAFFPTFYVSMVKAGEAAGMLDEVMDRLAFLGEEELELIGRVRSALAYPVLLVFLSLGIVAFLLIFILPKFTGIFEESGVVLPLPTRILLFISFLLRRFWFLLPVGVGAGSVWLGRYRRTPAGQARIHAAILRTPFLGALVLKTILSRAFRIMASLLKSGIAVVPALAVVEELMGNRVLSEATARVRQAVIGGKSLAEPFRAEKVFPVTISQLVAVGEKTGALDKTFLHLADYYEGEVDRALRTLTSVLEPLLLLTMGLLVGFIALSVLLPIFQLIKVFQR